MHLFLESESTEDSFVEVGLLEAVTDVDIVASTLVLQVSNTQRLDLVFGHSLEVHKRMSERSGFVELIVDLGESVLEGRLHRVARVDNVAILDDEGMGNTTDVVCGVIRVEDLVGIVTDSVIHLITHTRQELCSSGLVLVSDTNDADLRRETLFKGSEVRDTTNTRTTPTRKELENECTLANDINRSTLQEVNTLNGKSTTKTHNYGGRSIDDIIRNQG